jgi:IPT/TIG domain
MRARSLWPMAAIATSVLAPAAVLLDAGAVHGQDDGRRDRKPPVVIRFTPSGGPPGTRVTLAGENFGTDVRVAFGSQPLTLLERPARDTLALAIPASATASAPFVVTTSAGQTRSGAWFQLELPATVASMTPTSGPPGTRVTLRGSGFHGDERLGAGDDELRILERLPGSVVFAAPTHGGAILSMTSAGQSVALPFRFDIVAGAAVTSFAPTEGPPGTRVTLRGPGLGAADRVTYGGLSCPIRKRSEGLLVVEIPRGAAGEDAFSVETSGQSARSADLYHAGTSGPGTVGTFSPHTGPGGTLVTLEPPPDAEDLGAHVEIWLGDARCSVLRRDGRRVLFAIPDGATGRGPFIVIDDKGRRATTAELFEVDRR